MTAANEMTGTAQTADGPTVSSFFFFHDVLLGPLGTVSCFGFLRTEIWSFVEHQLGDFTLLKTNNNDQNQYKYYTVAKSKRLSKK